MSATTKRTKGRNTFSFAPSTSQIVWAPRWYIFFPGGCFILQSFCLGVSTNSRCAAHSFAMYLMQLPRHAIGHVLEAEVAHPEHRLARVWPKQTPSQ